jgi:hypothetical protein
MKVLSFLVFVGMDWVVGWSAGVDLTVLPWAYPLGWADGPGARLLIHTLFLFV